MAAIRHRGARAKGALLLFVTCQLCALHGWTASGALADGTAGVGGDGEPASSAPPGAASSPEAPEAPSAQAPAATTTTTAPAPSEAPAVTYTRRQRITVAVHRRAARRKHRHHHRGGKSQHNVVHGLPGAGTGSNPAIDRVAQPPRLVAARAGSLLDAPTGSSAMQRALGFYRIPLFLLPIYRAAALEYRVPWQVLAAINEVESDYGADTSTSSAGAVGWMQFLPSTWLQYGVDALGAGYADPNNPVDAIYAAARYLRAAGAARDLRGAIFAYNHADSYVESVLLRAELIATYPSGAIDTLTGLADAVLPVSGRWVAWSAIRTAHRGVGATEAAAPPSTSAAAPSPAAAATATRPLRLVDVRTEPGAPVVAVRSGRVIQIGSSRPLGRFLVLRDARGDMFTYAGLGAIASRYPAPRASRASHRPARLTLRVGSELARGTAIGRVRLPRGAKDGHLGFAIRPAGDPATIAAAPILASWRELERALRPHGAGSGAIAAVMDAAARQVAVSARAGYGAHTLARAAGGRLPAPLPIVSSGTGLTPEQWDLLIAQVARLRLPDISSRPSATAVPDPRATR